MYITKFRIQNVRSISDITVDFNRIGESTLFTGINGTGKSTILRSIAMGITDEDSAASVLREMPGEMVKKDCKFGLITVFLTQTNGKKFKIKTKINSQELFEKVDQKVYSHKNNKYTEMDQAKFPWGSIFTVGYGAGARTLGTMDYQYYVSIDALYSLFKSDAALQNAELSIRRLVARAEEKGEIGSGKKMENYITGLLKRLLNLEKDDNVILTSTSIKVKSSKWGVNEMSTLGDGYISTITWILDLFSWWLLHMKAGNKNILEHKEIKGIVLIDEIEKHLHPEWQVKIMKLLQEDFPQIQFIVTTHSPLVTMNSVGKSIKTPRISVNTISWENNSVISSVIQEPILELDYNQLLGSEVFGHMSDRSGFVQEMLTNMSELASLDNPTQKQIDALEKIKFELKSVMFPEGSSLIERIVEREYYSELEKKADFLKNLLK